MPQKIRWGVLGVARIATQKVIPAMQRSTLTEVAGIASRDLAKAQTAAANLGIPKAFGSYEELLADPGIDAIYNPLPNHLHLPWSIKAAEAGKHVLCEKPITLNVDETRQLIAARDRTGVHIGEAFMVDLHPQWVRTVEIIRSGEIGDLRAMNFVFSYSNTDPNNIRNIREMGGGAIMDIGCYPIHTARLAFAEEPARVCALIERDPEFGTDRLSSAMLAFPSGHAVFTSSTRMSPHQRAILLGTKGRIEIEIPVNAPPDKETRIFVHTPPHPAEMRTETFGICDQYTLQGDAFSRAILGQAKVPVPLENAVANMAVIDALFRSAEFQDWQVPEF